MIVPSSSTVTRFSARGRSSVESQKSTACSATSSSDQLGANFVSPGFSPRNIGAWDLPTIWMLPSGNSKSGPDQVEVVEPERLLKDGRVLLHARAPAPPGCCGTCSCARPGRSRWRARSGGVSLADISSSRAELAAPAADDDEVAGQRLLRPVVVDDHAGDRASRTSSVIRRTRLGVDQQLDVVVLERRPDAEHLGVGLGVHDAREAVAVAAAHAACCRACRASSSITPHGAWKGW